MIDPSHIRKRVEDDLYLEGEEVSRQVTRRRRLGSVWRAVFFGAAALAILILSILLLKIAGDALNYNLAVL